MLELLAYLSQFVSSIFGYCAIIVMVYGAFKAIFIFFYQIIYHKNQIEILRLELGQYLALGLEFLIGKDIIQTIVHPISIGRDHRGGHRHLADHLVYHRNRYHNLVRTRPIRGIPGVHPLL